jgi:nucleotide-binding universal stress UspA family protein
LTIEAQSRENNTKVQIRKILVPIDGSECSLNAAKYAIKVAKDENAQLFCVHVIASVPYGYAASPSGIGQYFKDIEQKVQSWFDKVKDMAKNEGIAVLKTEIFIDVKSVNESILDMLLVKI